MVCVVENFNFFSFCKVLTSFHQKSRVFFKGCGGTFFAKKGSPQSLIKSLTDYNIGQTLRDEE